MRRQTLVQLVGVGAVLLFVGGAGFAGACKLALNCHLRGGALAVTGGEIVLPEGFSSAPVVSGLRQPTAFDFLPDGRILIAEREGLVRIAENGRLADQPVVDLRQQVNTEFFRGLVSVAVDPDVETNGFFYVVYAVKRSERDPRSPTVVRVSRFTLTGASGGLERVIVGAGADNAESCTVLASSADCLPADIDHIGADIAFGADGALFIATGDGGGGGSERVEETAMRAQDVDALGGKILRVTRGGQGLASNPFFAGDTGANRSKVWALGLRNPFRLTLAPGSGLPVVGDVGWGGADEIDVAPAGANLGWPCYEGRARTMEYQATKRCAALYRRNEELGQPLITLLRSDASSVTGGVFYNARAYPERYRGSYFYADWAQSWIRHARIDPVSFELDGEPAGFAESAGGPVALRIGRDGLLYVLSLNYGEVRRIVYDS